MTKLNFQQYIYIDIYVSNKVLEAVLYLEFASCLTTPFGRDLFTIQHGLEYLIAFIKELPHNKKY